MALTILDDPNADTHAWLREVAAPRVDQPPVAAPLERVKSPTAGWGATKTTVKLILANAAMQAGLIGAAIANRWDPVTSIKWSLFLGALFYAIAACVVAMRSDDLGLSPVWLIGPWRSAVAIGASVGGALAVGLSALWTLADGHPVTDPFAGVLAGSNVAVLVGGGLLIAVAAPLVEELVFRGFLAEALRHKGRTGALLLSGIAFSIAHLRFAQFRYYLAMGVLLAGLYWARGLAASIAAHAAFNGLLVVFAIASVHGPLQAHVADGLSFQMPATWHEMGSPSELDLALVGPAGATLSVGHLPLPSSPAVNVDMLAAGLRASALPMSDALRVDVDSVRMTELPIGRAVRARATVDGHDSHAVFTIRNNELVIFELTPRGSANAMRDFDRALREVHAAGAL